VKLRVLVILVLLAAGGAAVFVSLGGLPTGGSDTASTYLTATAVTGDVTDEVAATGTIAPSATYALGFGTAPRLMTDTTTTAGTGTWLVEKVDAAVGQAVKKDEVLATASTTDLQRQLTSAKTSLASAQVGERQAKAALDAASGTDAIRQAKIGNYNALNSRRQAEATVADLKAQIALATLTAPIDGTVTSITITPGFESTGTAITVAAPTFEVTADVVESDISSMSTGQAATVTVSAINAAIGGTVSQIAPSAGSGSGSSSVVSFPVTVTLTGGPSTLRSGMTADITIVTASATNVLTIPSAALRGTSGDYRVQVMGVDGTLAAVPVTVGLVTSTTAEVRSGLSAGDVVVTGIASDRLTTTTTTTGRSGSFGGGGIAVPGSGGFRP
jgi:macrolide-specific efflux system membrane fusion protein